MYMDLQKIYRQYPQIREFMDNSTLLTDRIEPEDLQLLIDRVRSFDRVARDAENRIREAANITHEKLEAVFVGQETEPGEEYEFVFRLKRSILAQLGVWSLAMLLYVTDKSISTPVTFILLYYVLYFRAFQHLRDVVKDNFFGPCRKTKQEPKQIADKPPAYLKSFDVECPHCFQTPSYLVTNGHMYCIYCGGYLTEDHFPITKEAS